MGKRLWTQDEIKIVKDMYNNLKSINEIASIVNSSYSEIQRKVKDWGFYFKRSIPKSEEHKKKISKSKKRTNEYNKRDGYIIGITKNGYEFYIDEEDIELIKKYCWHKHKDGYLRTCYKTWKDEQGKTHNKYILMHRLVMFGIDNNNDYKIEIDHINGKPNDNRRCNMRKVTHEENMKNVKISTSNISGVKGVYFSKLKKKWKANISDNNKQIHLGTFDTFDKALTARKSAEEKYYGNFSRKGCDLLNGTR